MSSSKSGAGENVSPGDAGRDILDWLIGEYRLQQELCDVLEQIADALPGPIDPARAEFALTLLRSGLARHIAIQERILFPALHQRAREEDDVDALVHRIARDNTVDEDLAFDTADELEAALNRGTPENAEMLAYMLRGMFEGRRRHIAWELSVLVPLARARLKSEDLRLLSFSDIRLLLAEEGGSA